jgi:hypothetical protein
VDSGSTLVVIEHNLDVVLAADWIIDLGPEAGRDGGRVVFEGTPHDMISTSGTHTADHLRHHLGRSSRREQTAEDRTEAGTPAVLLSPGTTARKA